MLSYAIKQCTELMSCLSEHIASPLQLFLHCDFLYVFVLELRGVWSRSHPCDSDLDVCVCSGMCYSLSQTSLVRLRLLLAELQLAGPRLTQQNVGTS